MPDATTLIRTSSALRDARRLSLDATAALEPFLNSPLLASGQINLLSLDPIAERLGARWPARREPVYDYTERAWNGMSGSRATA